MTDNIFDLDDYRRKRIEAGTWPPNELTVIDYWKSRRGQGTKVPWHKTEKKES